MRVGKRSPLGPESSQSKRHVPRFLNSDSFPMSDTSLGLPLRVTGRPRPCLDLLLRPSFLVSHHVSRRFLCFSPSRWTVRAPCRLFPIVSTVAARAVSACFSSVFLPAVQRPVSSFTLVLVLRRDLVPAAPKISDVFRSREIFAVSQDFAGSALGHGAWRDRRTDCCARMFTRKWLRQTSA